MQQPQTKTRSIGKQNIMLLFFYGLFIALIVRLGYLQFAKHDYYLEKSKDQLKRIIRLYPERGDILDKNLAPIALTYPSTSTYIVPQEIEDPYSFVNIVAPITGMSKKDLQKKVQSKSHFVWLKQKMNAEPVKALKAQNLDGLGFIDVEKRTYPQGRLASQIIGFVGIDNQGLGGIEYQYDNHLKGNEGMLVLEGDPLGRQLVFGTNKTFQKNDGQSIILTIDSRIQFLAQSHLQNMMEYQEALGGGVVVMNAKNGEIVALVDEPGFDPNEWFKSPSIDRKNSCVTDVIEPGSTLKIFTIMAALEEGIVTPGTVLEVPETFSIAGHVVKEAHDREEDHGGDMQPVSEILGKSLNVGTSLIAKELGKKRLYKYLHDAGFGQPTGIQLPGESYGLLRKPNTWSGVDISMLSFGQGVAVTPIQMVSALSVVTNDGKRLQPRIVSGIMDAERRTLKASQKKEYKQTISKKTARQTRGLMQHVVENGTGKIVQLDGISVGGKTGTAQKPRESGIGYKKGAYVASFIGFLPVEDPEFIIYVYVDEPKKAIWGSAVAGPIFKKVAEDLVDHFNIEPRISAN